MSCKEFSGHFAMQNSPFLCGCRPRLSSQRPGLISFHTCQLRWRLCPCVSTMMSSLPLLHRPEPPSAQVLSGTRIAHGKPRTTTPFRTKLGQVVDNPQNVRITPFQPRQAGKDNPIQPNAPSFPGFDNWMNAGHATRLPLTAGALGYYCTRPSHPQCSS